MRKSDPELDDDLRLAWAGILAALVVLFGWALWVLAFLVPL